VAEADPAVRFEPCPPGTLSFFRHDELLGPETGWAGGFVVARPGCATLFVRRDGAAHSIRVLIGFVARCSMADSARAITAVAESTIRPAV
jgi:hypothetical protein